MTGTSAVPSSTAVVITPKTAGHAAQPCKPFAHKVPARFGSRDDEPALSAGTCRRHAEGDRLTLAAGAPMPMRSRGFGT